MILTSLHPITSALLRLEPSSFVSKASDSPWHDGNNTVIDTEKEWRVSVDVPGVKANDIDIKVDGGVLHISGVRKFEASDGHVAKKLRFSKSFHLPHNKYGDCVIDPHQLQASLSDGVLILQAPKKPRPEPVTISLAVNTTPNIAIENPPDDGKVVDTNTETERVNSNTQSEVDSSVKASKNGPKDNAETA